LGNVLILAREDIVAALLGLMVEVCGFQPRFLGKDESVEAAAVHGPFRAVLIDCDHPELDSMIHAIKALGVRPILFSPYMMSAEVSRLANEHEIDSFTLPTGTDAFARMLGS
jgi:hypothetical protein